MSTTEPERATLIHDRAPALTLAREALELVGRDAPRALEAADAACLAAVDQASEPARSVALRARALALRQLGRVEEAVLAGAEAADVAAATGAPELEAEARMSLAFVLMERGSIEAALAEADRASTLAAGRVAARLATQRALILQRAGRIDEALGTYRVALKALRRYGDTSWRARAHNNRGLLHAYHGRLRDAETDLRAALQLHRATGAELAAAEAEWNLGFVAARGGNAPAALHAFEEAEKEYSRRGRPVLELALDRAELLLSVGAFAEARETAGRAVRALQNAALDLHRPEALLIMAQATLADGEPGPAQALAWEAAHEFAGQSRETWAVLARYVAVRAEERAGGRNRDLFQRALDLADDLARCRWPVHELDMRLTAGTVALDLGDNDAAADQLRRASAARTARSLPIRLRAWYADALLRLATGDRAGAGRSLRTGTDLLARARATVGATELRMHVSGHGRDITGLGLRLALEDQAPRRVLAWAERSRAATLRLRPVLPPKEDEFAEALVALRRATAEAEAARLAGEVDTELERRVARCEATVQAHARRSHGVWSTAMAAVPTLDTITSTLGSRRLIEMVDVDGSVHALVVADGHVRGFRLADADAADAEARAVRSALRRLSTAPSDALSQRADATLRRSADVLDRLLLEPLRGVLGDHDVVLSPSSRLQSLPWSVLPSLVGRPVSVTPSAAVWLDAAARPRQEEDNVLGVAGPRLAHAQAEATSVARIRGGDVLRGAAATADAVAAAMATASCVHVACHGRLRADNPLLSSLELADGPLTVYDLERLPRVPELVVLPACQSGATAVRAGDEVMGLAHALLALGSRAVVAAVVPVPDGDTAPVMADLHRALARGAAPAAALAATQVAATARGARAGATAAAFSCFGAG